MGTAAFRPHLLSKYGDWSGRSESTDSAISMTASMSMGSASSWSGVISLSAKVLRVFNPRYLCSRALPGLLGIIPTTLTPGQ